MKPNRRITIAACIAALTACAGLSGCARQRDVNFVVVSAQSGVPIPNVRINVAYPIRAAFAPDDITVVSKDDGAAAERITLADRIDLTVDHPGYRPLTRTFFVEGDDATWTQPREPMIAVSAAQRPAAMTIIRNDDRNETDIRLALEWQARPTHALVLPGDFRGVILLTRSLSPDPLPEPPSPRVFTTTIESNGAALIPAWPITAAPSERFRFFTASGAELPSHPMTAGGLYVAKLREGAETLLFVVGDEHDETALRNVLWNFSPTGDVELNVEAFAHIVQRMGESRAPVNPREFSHLHNRPVTAAGDERSVARSRLALR